jgi:oxygen-dependent protoporphyrinogen oxidase
VVVATPAYVAGELVAGLDAGAAEALRAIPYAPIAVVCMGWALEHVAHPLDGFGFLVAPGGGKRTLGCIWTSSLFPGQAPDGHVLFRAMLGGARDPDVLGQSDGELCALVRKELCDVLPMTGEPTLERVYRWERGIPQYVLGHGARLAAVQALEEANPGLAVAGNAYRGIGLNECVLSAQRAVDRVVVDERGRR